jgi:hypothetical protein
VNWSAATVGDVPAGVVTVTSTVPAGAGGAVAVICVEDTTVKLVAGKVPNETPVAPEKLLPLIVTSVPPPVLPDDGLIPVTAGRDAATKVNWSADEVVEVPLGVVTVMSTVPAARAGDVAVIWLSERTVKLLAAVPPKETALAPVKLLPVMVTTVPPAVVPDVGEMPVTAGAGAVT